MKKRNQRVLAMIVSATFVAGALSGCVSHENLNASIHAITTQNMIIDEATDADTILVAAQTSPEEARDIWQEWESQSGAAADDALSAPPANTQPFGSPLPSVSPAPSASPEEEPPFGLPTPTPETSSLPAPSPLAPAEAEAAPPMDTDINTPSPFDASMAVPTHEGLYFGMNSEEVRTLYASAVFRSGRDGLGQFLQFSHIDDFADTHGELTAEFYFDNEDKLVAVFYHYGLLDAQQELSASYIEQQMNAWTTLFGPIDATRYYNALNENAYQDANADIYDLLNGHGRVICCWYGHTTDIMISMDNRMGSDGHIDIYMQRNDAPLVNLPAPEVAASYAVNDLYQKVSQNEIAALHDAGGKYTQISGPITRIARDAQGKAYVSLEKSTDGLALRAYFSEKQLEELLPLKKGETVQLAGFLQDIVTDEEDNATIVLMQSKILTAEEFGQNVRRLSGDQTATPAASQPLAPQPQEEAQPNNLPAVPPDDPALPNAMP